MRQLLPVLLLTLCVVLCGCAASHAPSVGSPTGGDLGYDLEKGEVVFRFEASEYDNVTRNDNGKWLTIGEVGI